MSAAILLVLALVALFVAYLTYGAFLAKKLGVDPNRTTPAHQINDGVDYVPAKAPVLLGHHFASIAGAAPIIGPITAAVFGWVPVALWIVFGGIFFGAMHDFSSLVASLRHGGKSIGEIINENIGPSGKKLFAIFAWLTLILVMAVFAVVIGSTFVATPAAGSASVLFILIAIVFGFAVYRNNVPMGISSIIGVALLFVAIWLGMKFPLAISFSTWIYVLFLYAAIASVTPVWILLQPRDYLNSFLLYGLMAGGVIGILITNPSLQMPAFGGFKTGLGYLFPVLFVTVACGAISGFHSIVSSGTTSKQLDKESDAKLVGYGAMLIESVLAMIAIIAAAVLVKEGYVTELGKGGPGGLFSRAVGGFMTSFGIPQATGVTFAALVVSAFAMTTLDTATRLGRFIFQEFFESDGEKAQKSVGTNMYFATIITIVPAVILALTGSWKLIWPIFGAANQLLAALALMAVSAWLAKMGKDNSFAKYPMYFMFLVTLSALGFMMQSTLAKANYLLFGIAVALFILGIILLVQSFGKLSGSSPNQKSVSN